MTKLLHIFAALLLVAAASGCRRDTHALERMEHAEAIMAAHPDSALDIMEAIDPGTLRSGRARALHALLLTQARDKNYIDQTDDSLILVALEYFHPSAYDDSTLSSLPRKIESALFPELNYQMLSRLYYARILMCQKKRPEAIAQLRFSEKECIELKDTFFLSQIYGDLAIIYGEVFCAKEELHYAQMAYEILKPWNHPDYTAWAQCEVARALTNNYRHKEALAIFDSISQQKDILASEPNLHGQVLLGKSICFYSLENYNQAFVTLDSVQKNFPDAYTLHYIRNHHFVAIKSGRKKEAAQILKKLLQYDEGFTPSYLFEDENDYKNAYSALKKEQRIVWDWFKTALLQELTLTDTEIQTEKLYKQEQHTRRLKRTLYILAIVIIIAVAITTIIIKRRITKSQQIQQQRLAHAQSMLEEIDNLKSQNTNLSNQINKLFGEKYSMIDKLLTVYSTHKGTKIERKKIYEEVDTLLKSFETPETQSKITNIVDEYFDGMATRFRTDFPKIKNEDYMLFLYFVCGFSNYSIMLLLDIPVSTIYSRKKRIKAKILQSTSQFAEKYLHFF